MLPIESNFQVSRVATAFQNLQVWKDHSCNIGIYGTNAAVDFDLCIEDAACVDVCPFNVFDWQGAAIEMKALTLREHDCIYCPKGEVVGPKFATWVRKP